MNEISKVISIIFICFSVIFSQSVNRGATSFNSIGFLTGEEYVTGDDGIPRITLNIWGHVKYPGTYLMYDGVDILTALSISGGPIKGAKTSNIRIISKNGESKNINLDELIDNNNVLSVRLKPHDTIYVDENIFSYILSRGNFINVLIQVTNLFLIAQQR